MASVSRIVKIQNKKGLHARAAAKFVKTVTEYNAEVRVARLGNPPESLVDASLEWAVSGRSILGLMMLAAEPGVELELIAEGGERQEVLDALELLINNLFDEGE